MITTTCKPLDDLFQVFYFDYATTTEYCWIIKAEDAIQAKTIAQIYAEENGIIGGDIDEVDPIKIDLICFNTYSPDYPKNIQAIRGRA